MFFLLLLMSKIRKVMLEGGVSVNNNLSCWIHLRWTIKQLKFKKKLFQKTAKINFWVKWFTVIYMLARLLVTFLIDNYQLVFLCTVWNYLRALVFCQTKKRKYIYHRKSSLMSGESYSAFSKAKNYIKTVPKNWIHFFYSTLWA
jgi:hypothetical protein